MKKIVGLLTVAVLFGSCGLSKNVVRSGDIARPQYFGEITVLDNFASLPEGAEQVATIFIGDKGATVDCSYNKVLAESMKQARKYGGNYLVINRHFVTGLLSDCHQIASTAYWVDPSLLNKQKEVKKEEKNTDE